LVLNWNQAAREICLKEWKLIDVGKLGVLGRKGIISVMGIFGRMVRSVIKILVV
jgi:hypothetical protein